MTVLELVEKYGLQDYAKTYESVYGNTVDTKYPLEQLTKMQVKDVSINFMVKKATITILEVKEETKVKIMATYFDEKKLHPYMVETKGKHPVHIIEGGRYITEDMEVYDESGDMGTWWLNQREYDYFKAHLKEVEITVRNN